MNCGFEEPDSKRGPGTFAEAHFERGMAQLALGDFANGWAAYERRWDTGTFAPSRRGFTSPLWTGAQPLAGKTVLLHGEQGLGDTLQFVRYVPLVAARGATVVLEVQPELLSLLDGFGLHWSVRGGWVWNIWGWDCVVVRHGSTTFVGTNDAENLAAFLRTKFAAPSS